MLSLTDVRCWSPCTLWNHKGKHLSFCLKTFSCLDCIASAFLRNKTYDGYNNNNNNNNRISIAPYGRNFRGAGGTSDQCSVKAWLNRKVLNRQRITDENYLWQRVPDSRCWKRESTLISWTVCPAAEWWLNVKIGCKRVLRFGGVDRPEWTCSELCMSELPTCMWSAAGLATNAVMQ